MAKRGPHLVQCYLCGRRFEVGRTAKSVSCPGCYKPVITEDLTVKTLKPVAKVQTTGSISVTKKGRIISELVTANDGITVEGTIDAKHVKSGGPVVIGAKASFRGNLKAPSLIVKQGAKILGGEFDIPSDPLEVEDMR